MKTLSKTFNILLNRKQKKSSRFRRKQKTTAEKINNNAVNVPTGINIIPQSKENLHKTPILASINNGGISEQMLNDELKNKINASTSDIYSVDEHVVGTWIDGQPVYEKTLVDNMGGSAGDGKTIDITELFIEQVVELNGFFDIETAFLPLNFYLDDSSRTYAFIDMENNNIFYRNTKWDFSGVIFTLRYTKTTDTEV